MPHAAPLDEAPAPVRKACTPSAGVHLWAIWHGSCVSDAMKATTLREYAEPVVLRDGASLTLDPSLGPVLVAGIGGVQVELQRDVSFRITPASDVDAELNPLKVLSQRAIAIDARMRVVPAGGIRT